MDFWRQWDLLTPDDWIYPCLLAGAGGLGSWIALLLAKMGCPKLYLYDFDRVEEHNLPNQYYPLHSVGRLKAEMLAEQIAAQSESVCFPSPEPFPPANGKTPENTIWIVTVDSMAERNKIWQHAADRFRKPPFYIDVRMGGQVCRLYAIRPGDPLDVRFYQQHCYDDHQAEELPCTAQGIGYTGFLAAALVGSQIKKFLRGESFRREIVFDMHTLSLLAAD